MRTKKGIPSTETRGKKKKRNGNTVKRYLGKGKMIHIELGKGDPKYT